MKIYEKQLDKSPMTRPGESIDSVKYIVLHGLEYQNITALSYRNYLNSLAKQTTTYTSVHYIIGLEGEIISCIPESEIAWHAGTLEMNYKSLGIQWCHMAENGRPNKKTRESIELLLSYLCKRYELDPLQDILLHYDVNAQACPRYYVEHREEFEQLKKQVKGWMEEEIS